MTRTSRSRIASTATGIAGILALLGVALTSVSCTSIQPIQKIGIVAPFEGLYRETGYASLDAVRRAIDDCAPSSVSVIPLALDNSGLPGNTVKAAEKLLQDTALIAVVGPYDYTTTTAAVRVFSNDATPWISPVAVNAEGAFVELRLDDSYIDDIVLIMAEYAIGEGADSVYVLGSPQGLTMNESANTNSIEVHNLTQPTAQPGSADIDQMAVLLSDVGVNDAVIWLGNSHTGAQIASELHQEQPTAAFWLSPVSDITVFSEHYRAIGDVYWVSWTMPKYNTELQDPVFGAATSELTYQAACEALSKLDTADPLEPVHLTLSAHRLNSDGTNTVIEHSTDVTE